MWCLTDINTSFEHWFSDGKPFKALRGQKNESSRLIVDQQGFLDITQITSSNLTLIDANGLILWPRTDPEHNASVGPSETARSLMVQLSLTIELNGSFTLILLPTATSTVGTTGAGIRN